MKRFLYSVLLVAMAVPVIAQNNGKPMPQFEMKDAKAHLTEGYYNFDANFDFTKLELSHQEELLLTPVLVSADGSVRTELPALLVQGATRHKVYKRELALKNKIASQDETVLSLKELKRSGSANYAYSAKVGLFRWMPKAGVEVHAKYRGCADCGLGEMVGENTGRLIPKSPAPVFPLNFAAAPVEDKKIRTERHVARLNYVVSRHEILPTYKNNAAELAAVDSVMRELKDNKTLKVNGFIIEGYASPEGPYDFNMKLSENRARSFTKYLSSTYQYPMNMFTVKWFGEDWAGLREWVDKSDLSNRTEILDIIDKGHKDSREAQIKALDGGETYRFLLETVFPPLRRSEEYVVGLEVRNYSNEEVAKIMLTHPNRISLTEYASLSNTLQEGSAEQLQLWQIAAKTYPDAPVARINYAVALAKAGNPKEAMNQVAALRDNPDALRVMAAAAMQAGEPYAAMAALENLVRMDEKDAVDQMTALNNYLNDMN